MAIRRAGGPGQFGVFGEHQPQVEMVSIPKYEHDDMKKNRDDLLETKRALRALRDGDEEAMAIARIILRNIIHEDRD